MNELEHVDPPLVLDRAVWRWIALMSFAHAVIELFALLDVLEWMAEPTR